MGSAERAMALRSEFEAALLKLSVRATFLIAALGMVFGVLSGSVAIIFDGLFSLIDAAITWLMLVVARLVARESNQKFQYGYWHLEPLVLGLKAAVLLILIAFGFLGALESLLSGGYTPTLGAAIQYAAITVIICFSTWFWMWRQNDRLGSELVRVDSRAWLASGFITLALLVAFALASLMEGGDLAWLVPYVDPLVLALVSLAILPVPLLDARRAFRDIFGIVPADLDARVRSVMTDFVARHGFLRFESYVGNAGRARFIEISVLAPPHMPPRELGWYDGLRKEIGQAIGDGGPERWLTISFTADPSEL